MRGPAALLLIVLIGGCANATSNENPPKASAPGGTPSASATSMPQWLERVQTCLEEEGWEVSVDYEQNGIAIDNLPTDQQAAYRAADEACEKAAGRAPNDVPMTAERAKEIFRHLIKAATCLEDEGYPSSEPPSESKFVDDYLSGNPPWSPFLEVPDSISEDEWRALLRKCPQEPQ